MKSSVSHQWFGYILAFMLLVPTQESFSQFKEDRLDSFGASLYREVNGLIDSRSLVSAEYIHGRRTFELGLVINHQEASSGVLFRHQLFLNSTEKDRDYDPDNFNLRPYLVYQFIYDKDISDLSLRRDVDGEAIPVGSEMSKDQTFRTIEHYLGLGLEADLLPHIYLNVYAGCGLYFYRHDTRMVLKDEMLLPEQMTGFNWNVSLGLGYRFR